MLTEKKCSKCDTVKEADEYYPDVGKTAGLSTYCIPCDKARVKIYQNNRYDTDPEFRAMEIKRVHNNRMTNPKLYAADRNRRKHRDQQFKEGVAVEGQELRDFFKNCPEGMQTDHIIPLSKGGLTRLSNLQYLTPRENMLKGNKLDYELA